MKKILVRNLDIKDNLSEVAELIYYTDNWVYPAMFDNDIEIAKKVISEMIKRKTIFNFRNIKIAVFENHIVGIMVLINRYPPRNYVEMKKSFEVTLGYVTPRFDETMEDCFSKYDYIMHETHILNLCVAKKYRRKSIAQTMIQSLSKDKAYTLTCVSANFPARKLYEKMGFDYIYEFPGFTGVKCVELMKKPKGSE